MKKITFLLLLFFSLLLSTVFLLLPLSAESGTALLSGTFSDGLLWSFDEATGVLTISGNGAMEDFQSLKRGDVWYNGSPWCSGESARLQVRKLVVEEGVTSIGK